MEREHPTLVAAFAVALGVAFAANAAGTWYAKPEATGTGDGLSWANATTVSSAVDAAGTAGGGDVYVAKGVHYPGATLQVKNGVNLYGGFLGDGSDTFATRDPKANETIVCGDTGKNDVWTLLHPATGTSETTTQPIVKDGKINIPTFANEYDTCWNALSKGADLSRLVNVAGSATNVLDGLVFACGGYNDYAGAYLGSKANVTLSRCRFVACYSAYPILFAQSGNQTTVTNCTFEYCRSVNYGVVHLNGSSTVVDCDFIGNYRAYAGIADATGAVALKVDQGCYVRKCRFSRNYLHHGNAAHAQASVCIARTDNYTSSGVSGCTMTHNSAYDTTGQATPMLRHNMRYQITENCTIASNRVIVATDAKSVVAVAAHYANVAASGVLVSCSVFDNEISVSAPNATQVDAAPVASVSSGVDTDMTLLNCTFRDNAVSVTSGAEATNNVARAALMRVGADPNKHRVLAVFNSTFSGATAGPDILYAGTELEGGGCVAYNSVLWATGAAAKTPRVVNAGIAPVKVGYSTVVDPTALADNVTQTEVRSDDPLVEDLASLAAGRVPVTRLGAAVPGVRTTVDVIKGHYWTATVYWHKFPGSSTWLQCANYTTHTPSAAEQQAFLADALATARTAGTFTEGAVQALAPLAETGRTVVFAVDPVKAGYVSGGNTHVMAADVASYPITAVSTNAYLEFHSWRDTDGAIVSTANPYVLSSPGHGTTVLTARFNPAKVTYTFDLGAHGTFDACGLSVTNIVLNPDDPVVVPAYTCEREYAVRRWNPELPSVAGAESVSFAAVYVTRVTTVEPGGDIADALAGAATYPGEAVVLLGSGTHTLTASLSVPGNVTLAGRDGAVLAPGLSTVTYAVNGESDADTTAPCRVENVTFSLAGVQPGYHVATFRDCIFTNVTRGTAALTVCTNVTVTGCTFAGNRPAFFAFTHDAYSEYPCVFTNCDFVGNLNGTGYVSWREYYTARKGVVMLQNALGQFVNCRFRENLNSLQDDAAPGILCAGDKGALRVAGCRFTDNLSLNAPTMFQFGRYSSGQYVRDSAFTGNRVIGISGNTSTATASLLSLCGGDKVSIYNCSFVSNAVDCTAMSASSKTVLMFNGSFPGLMNCYLDGNRALVQTSSTSFCAYIFQTITTPYSFALCNCTFYRNEATTGIFHLTGTQGTFYVHDCIFADAEGTNEFAADTSSKVTLQLDGCIIPTASRPAYSYMTTLSCIDADLRFGRCGGRQGHLVRQVTPLKTLLEPAVTVATDARGTWAYAGGKWVIARGLWGSGLYPTSGAKTPIADMFGKTGDSPVCGAYRVSIRPALRIIGR